MKTFIFAIIDADKMFAELNSKKRLQLFVRCSDKPCAPFINTSNQRFLANDPSLNQPVACQLFDFAQP